MPRRYASQATATQPEAVREAPRPPRRRRPVGAHARTSRLSKRVVQKPDGRYLVYYEQSVGTSGSRLARKA